MPAKVALRKESVDRNVCYAQGVGIVTVALRKESVDRNVYQLFVMGEYTQSLSARRAWIEMYMPAIWDILKGVALRKESVDRNPNPLKFCAIC